MTAHQTVPEALSLFNNPLWEKGLRKEKARLQVFTAFAVELEGLQGSGEKLSICCRMKLLPLLEQGRGIGNGYHHAQSCEE